MNAIVLGLTGQRTRLALAERSNPRGERQRAENRSSILFVANHAFDCIGPKSYGMRTALVDRRKRQFGQTPHQPDLVVADFSELAAMLA